MPKTDKVFIRDLTIEMSIGIYNAEKQNKQRVIINVDMNVASNADKSLRSINDVVSYEDITNDILSLTQSQHFDLVETLSEQIANLCLKHTLVENVRVSIEKPDIIDQTKSVGVEISRTRRQ